MERCTSGGASGLGPNLGFSYEVRLPKTCFKWCAPMVSKR